ncbi:hypothetical protein Cantr_05728 [Candida viswanathii]|uniref:Inheritance of peroxisomes protein 1 n=1 Tax=Candida viswanathii TaxID=5486 RepID=A0A367XQ62_9ASCO|nr:hypothetical protein Cantr_05728 [Candida viswanathii]
MANENSNPHDLVGKKKNKRNHNKRKFRNRAHEPSAHGASPKQNKQSLSLSPTAQPSTTSLSQQHDQDHDQPLQQQLAENYQGVITPPPPPIEHLQGSNSYKSPRKEAISRYKQDHLNSFNAFSDLKENLKSNDTVQRRGQQPSVENNDIPSLPLSLDDKISLFKYKSVEILEIANQNNISGSLLAHGIFEVFQLHRGDVTFLSCGSTFVYPLLPKTKILRINLNQFMLPLAKPERYWKISVHCEEKGSSMC